MDVYIDMVIFLNFGVDYLLLRSAGRLAGCTPSYKNSVMAAVFGGMYAGACVVPGLTFLGNTLYRIISLVIMSVIAFGWQKNSLQRCVLFILLSMTLGGIVLLIGHGGLWSVIMSAFVLGGLCLLGFRGTPGKMEYVSVWIRHGDRTVNLTALLDTGNRLRDPISGLPVLVADSRTAMELLCLSESELLHPVEIISRGKHMGLRLIPYCAVGQPSGMLLGLQVDEMRINGKRTNQVVAFAPQRIGQGSGYEALTGGIL